MDVGVANFGPLASADVRIRPLTVFVGPNNSGKSYLAMLLYSLLRPTARRLPQNGALDRLAELTDVRDLGGEHVVEWLLGDDAAFLDAHRNDLQEWFGTARSSGRIASLCVAPVLPSFLHRPVEALLDAALWDYGNAAILEVERCVGAEAKDLVNRLTGASSARVALQSSKPDWSLELHVGDQVTRVANTGLDLSSVAAHVDTRSAMRLAVYTEMAVPDMWRRAKRALASAFIPALFKAMRNGAFYLPAARSGFLQSQRALAAAYIQRSAFAGIQRLDIPTLPGVVADFISQIITLPYGRGGQLEALAAGMEREILKGELAADLFEPSPGQIVFRANGQETPLHRASSMVAELAPVILLVKHALQPGDLMIIEEPESHLHPANQRKFALVIARLIRAGVRILLTTHSDFFLAELSNCIRRSRRTGETADYILPAEAAAYLFAPSKPDGSSTVRELAISADDGIPEDSFLQAAEELYEETAYLQEASVLTR